ncbi:hypothetical protein [Solimonas variicoloris]|uniref:hypothetical protein n=1 Tax=Solimonas variicoloris TaxID=254408 RepID=UPI000374C3C6|nr:hypothetical protein [Solimonas variicoloris]
MNYRRDDEIPEEADDALRAALRGLDFSEAPQRELWPGIEARIAPRRRLSANGWMGLAAAACVTAVIGLTLLPPPAPPDAASATRVAGPATAADLRAVPGSRALVKANLQLSRSSEQQIRKALQQDPDSESLRRLLTTTQSRSDELRRMLAAQST